MKEVHFFYSPNAVAETQLPPDESLHALRVLRLKEGDEIYLLDGKGFFYNAVISMVASKKCFYEIKERLEQEKTWKGWIHLAIAPTKSIDRIEWMVEKAVEVGVDEISFLNTRFTERNTIKTERIEKIVVAAVKQSRKAFMPKVNGMVSFDEFISREYSGRKFISHCYEEIPRIDLFERIYTSSADDILVLVGPEGDFSFDEVTDACNMGYESVTFGKSRLRTETAGLMAVVMANMALRKT